MAELNRREMLISGVERARQLPSWAGRGTWMAAARFDKSRGLYLNLLNGVGGGMLSTAVPKEALGTCMVNSVRTRLVHAG